MVPGDGQIPCEFMLVGEAPGAQEERTGRPFVGAAGKELWPILEDLGLPRTCWYVTNVVKERPPENRDPTAEEVEYWRDTLLTELDRVQPRLVLAVGRISAEWFLRRPVTMERDYGKLFEGRCDPGSDPTGGGHDPGVGPASPDLPRFWVLVSYHPAAALHSPETYTQLWMGLRMGIEAYQNAPERPQDAPGRAIASSKGVTYLARPLSDSERSEGVLGADTEMGKNDTPLGASFSRDTGTGVWVGSGADGHRQGPLPPLALHNALYDLPVLDTLGYRVGAYEDTMIMAHILGRPRVGLKMLAYRELDLEMSDYEDMVRPAQDKIADEYLGAILDKYTHKYQEQISEKTGKPLKPRLLPPGKVFAAAARCLKNPDPYGLWTRQKPERHQEALELLGYPMPEATLEDV